jgi:hemerythrin-like domain-containing protein
MMKPTEELTKEHDAIKEMLGIMDRISEKLENKEGVNPEHLEQILEFLRTFADRCHHGKEEDLLFPAMIDAGIPREGGPIAVMLREHKIGRTHIKNMEEGIAEYKKSRDVGVPKIIENVRGYSTLLTQHIDKEDNVLYPMADESLSEQKQNELRKGFEEVEKNIIGEGKHEEFHRLIHRLKDVYLG